MSRETKVRRARTPILDDLPAERDGLDFKPYAESLADIVASPATSTPLTVGVFGDWGSGKTTLMRMMMRALPESARVAWFDAWKYEQEAALWRALLLRVLGALRGAIPAGDTAAAKRARAELDDLETSLYRAVDREEVGKVEIDWGKLLAGVGKGAVQVGLSFIPGAKALAELVEQLREQGSEGAAEDLLAAIRRERSRIHIEQVRFIEQFQDRFRDLVEAFVRRGGEGPNAARLVVFVDDLDRCLPEKAVEVLEAIKLFLDVPGCVFVLGLDRQVVARGIEIKYRELGRAGGGEDRRRLLIDGGRYLEKIIQLPFQIPPIEPEDMGRFVAGLVSEWPHDEIPRVFAQGLGENPRQVKRTVNVFLLLWRLAGARRERLGGLIQPVRLAKVVAIQHVAPDLYDLLRETPRLLRELEAHLRKEAARSEAGRARGAEGEAAAPLDPPPVLAPFVARPPVRRLLTLHPQEAKEFNFADLSPDELRLYFTLTRRAEAPAVAAGEVAGTLREPQTVRVPAGPFTMGSSEEEVRRLIAEGMEDRLVRGELPQHTLELPEYAIGKYPVTNAEYQAFVRDAGNRPPRHWAGDRYPEGKGDHPVVEVSWHDARAYCEWLSERTSRVYRLPSEAEWEKAARGTDGRTYPWGQEWDAGRLNSAEGEVGDTTPVGRYSPAGDSPYGSADMAGNVWEWTRSLWGKATSEPEFKYPYDAEDGREDLEDSSAFARVLRGGAFNYSPKVVRCAYRDRGYPIDRSGDIGFRVVLSPSSSGL